MGFLYVSVGELAHSIHSCDQFLHQETPHFPTTVVPHGDGQNGSGCFGSRSGYVS